MAQIERKVVLLGDSAVGKTALARRFVDDEFEDSYRPTPSARPWKKKLDLSGEDISYVIWDIAGSTLQLHPAFYAGTHGALLVCDLSKRTSSDSLTQWHNALMSKVGIVPVIVLANKSDLEHECDIEYIKKYGYDALEVSARTGEGVNEAFMELAKLIL